MLADRRVEFKDAIACIIAQHSYISCCIKNAEILCTCRFFFLKPKTVDFTQTFICLNRYISMRGVKCTHTK